MKNNQRLRVYLAGAVDKSKWRGELIKACEGSCIEWLSPEDNLSFSFAYQVVTEERCRRRVFDIGDILKVERTDIVFAYFKKGTKNVYAGTNFECGYAKALGKKLIIACDMNKEEKRLYEFPIRQADKYFESLEEAVEHLRDLAAYLEYVPKEE